MSTTFPLPQAPRVTWSNAAWARIATDAPRVPWDKFLSKHFRWLPGEHVALIGPTGRGKTTMLTELLPLKPYVVVFATKPKDDTMDTLIRGGYLKIRTWRSISARDNPRRVLWPDARRLDSEKVQREVFADALDRIYREGGWTVAIDELWYVINKLGLDSQIKTYLLQARSLGISLIVSTQRPAWVPLEVYSQSTHLFFWRGTDAADLRRLSEINTRSAEVVRQTVSNLEQFQVLYVNTLAGHMVRTRAPKPGG